MHGSFLAGWQVQSKLATIVMFGLLAVNTWLALAVMLGWTVAATFAYYTARERGVPDFLAMSSSTCRATRTGQMLGGVWLVGINAFAFANVVRPLLREGSIGRRSPVMRAVVLAVGLIFFGVTTNQHMLQVAGYHGPKLLGLSSLGAFLNVPYRVFCGALTLHLLLGFMSLGFTHSYI
jgi:hypothetical protein